MYAVTNFICSGSKICWNNSVYNYEILDEFQNNISQEEEAYINFFTNSTSNTSILKKLDTFTSSLCSILEELDNLKFLRIQLKQNLTNITSQHEEPQLFLDKKLKESRNKGEK